MNLEVIEWAAFSIFVLIIVHMIFQRIGEHRDLAGINIFKCGSTAICTMIANIVMFTFIYLTVPQSWLDRMAYLWNPAHQLINNKK